MANLSRYCERIQESLLRYCDSLKVDSRGNLQNEALYAEYVFRDVTNLAFGWNLKNANEDDVLTAGFDLVDPEERILIQVTLVSSIGFRCLYLGDGRPDASAISYARSSLGLV